MTRVLLLGAMGTGKSSVGRALAELLGVEHLDNDDLLLDQTGVTARALLARSGEEALRQAETDVLASVVRRPGSWVAGVAAGAVLDPQARALVRDSDALVVWLAAPPEALAERVAGTDRPWLGDDPRELLEDQLLVRAPLYAELADEVVDVTAATPQQTAERLARLVS